MPSIILVHGAFHGGWCWERVVPLLEAKGHRVLAPDLPGLGADKTPLGEVGLERWAGFVADLARAQDGPVLLVGHSRGGIVISRAAELAPEVVVGLIYLAAMLVPDGETMTSVSRAHASAGAPSALVIEQSENRATGRLTEVSLREGLYQCTPPELVDRAVSLCSPEPMAPFGSVMQVSADRFGRVPRAYIECAEDRTIPLGVQRGMQSILPCDPVVTLQTDHSPAYSAPAQLAEAIDAIAGRFAVRAAA